MGTFAPLPDNPVDLIQAQFDDACRQERDQPGRNTPSVSRLGARTFPVS